MSPPAAPTPQSPPSVADALAAKIARIEWLRGDNAADRFPSFQARLADAATVA